jgi:hypothetical protein
MNKLATVALTTVLGVSGIACATSANAGPYVRASSPSPTHPDTIRGTCVLLTVGAVTMSAADLSTTAGGNPKALEEGRVVCLTGC